MKELQITIGDVFAYEGTTWTRSSNVLYDLHATRGNYASDYYGLCTDIDVETPYTLPWKVWGTFLSYYMLDHSHAYNIAVFARESEKWEGDEA